MAFDFDEAAALMEIDSPVLITVECMRNGRVPEMKVFNPGEWDELLAFVNEHCPEEQLRPILRSRRLNREEVLP